jgi:protein-tyrosine phosphatase
VLCVCLGNICRSPYAEALLRRSLPGIEIRSAGFLAGGRPPPDVAIAAAAERGIDISRHLSVQLAVELLEWAELILVMDGSQARRVGHRLAAPTRATLVEVLGDFDPAPIGKRVIPDPFGREPEFFDEVYVRVEDCCGSLSRAFRPA